MASRTPTPTPNINPPPITISLTWGTRPADLDAHLSGPAGSGSIRFHLYWSNTRATPFTSISDDDGNGPETVTITKNPATGTWVAGEYHVWAHNYIGNPGFADSSAKITVKRGTQTLGVYNVADATGAPSARRLAQDLRRRPWIPTASPARRGGA